MSGDNYKHLSNRDNVIFLNRDRVMQDVLSAQDLFRDAFPERRHGSVKAAIYEGYRFMSRRLHKQFTERRARSIYEGTARRIDSEEMDILRVAILEESKREQKELRARLASLDAMLASVDEAFHRETLEAIRAQEGGSSRMDNEG